MVLGLEGIGVKLMKFVWIFLFTSVLSLSVSAKESPPFLGRVQVSVSASDSIKGKIESYLSRELRSLGDIVVTDDNPRWLLSIVALESESKGGYKTGVDLSVVILKPFNNQLLIDNAPEKSKEAISFLTSSLYSYSDHWLLMGAPEELRSICNRIIADFDSRYLNESRKVWRLINEYLKSQETKSPDK